MDKNERQAMFPSSRSVIIPLVFVLILIALIIISFLGIAGVDISSWLWGHTPDYSYNRLLMDTSVNLNIYTEEGEDYANQVADEVFSEMENYEQKFDRGLEGSEIYKINEKAGQEPVQVSSETMELIERSIHYGELTEGSFDITIAPVMDKWGFYQDETRLPGEDELSEIIALVDYQKIEIDEEQNEVFLPAEEMGLDLGGIAKGFVVEQGMEILEEKGIDHAYLEAGGDIRVKGGKPVDEDQVEPWRIGISDPRNGENRGLVGIVSLETSAVVTSGDYERYFMENDTRYHHIIDPSTGYPAEGVISATVFGDNTIDINALSTAIVVMGLQEGMELIEELPETEAVVITTEQEIYKSQGIKDKVELVQ